MLPRYPDCGIALGATEYKRYPKDEKPTKDNTTIGVSWEHGIYLGSTLSTTNFKAYKSCLLYTSTMNSALKGIVAGVMMAGISTVLTFLGF